MSISVVGLVGPMGSGKDFAAEILQKKGFKKISLSDQIRKVARKENKPENDRKTLQDLGDRLREEHGVGILALRAISEVYKDKDTVFTSIRHPAEIDTIRFYIKDPVIIAINASAEKRFERIKKRGREGDPDTWEEFLEMDKREWSGLEGHGIDLEGCFSLADREIRNELDSEIALARELERALDKRLIEGSFSGPERE